MEDEFVNWDDLNLDDILGEDNWTDDEIVTSENDWESNSDEGTAATKTSSADKENETPTTTTSTGTASPAKKSTRKSTYKCPFCEKMYTSTSGFRGHVTKKHDRPDIKAHMNKMDKQASDETCQLPKKSVPLSTEDDLRREMPSVVKGTFHRITQDKFHQRPCSKYGQTMILISQQLLAVQLTILHMLLISSIVPMFSSSTDFSSSRFLLCVNKLRDDPDFIESMIDFILTNINFELELRLAKMYAQRFLTCFTTTYFHRQLQLLDVQQQMDNAVISKNDKEVLFYICGYILHALKKRYLKSKVKHSDLLNMLEHLFSNDQKRNDYSEWTDKLDRGGLKRPGEKFFRLIVQIERWVRDVVSIPNLHTNSLVNLKEKLCDYALLRSSWDCMIEDTDIKKWLMLDHVVSLFVKVRGFAVTKLVRKQLQKKRKDAKVTAGSRKALRKELRNLSNPK